MSSWIRSLLLAALVCGAAAPSAGALPPGAVNGIVTTSGASAWAVASVGFNAVTVNPFVSDLNTIQGRGLNGIVWLGGYDNVVCEFTKTDTWVRQKLDAVKSHTAVVAYQIDDEPKSTECPSAPAQIAARSQLVKSLDPGSLTVLAHFRPYEFRDFAGSADVLAVVSYPCSHKYGCRYSKITDAVKAARDAGWQRLWAMPQTFGDGYYRIPTPLELQMILLTWNATGVEGSLSYVWDQPGRDALIAHPEFWPLLNRMRPVP